MKYNTLLNRYNVQYKNLLNAYKEILTLSIKITTQQLISERLLKVKTLRDSLQSYNFSIPDQITEAIIDLTESLIEKRGNRRFYTYARTRSNTIRNNANKNVNSRLKDNGGWLWPDETTVEQSHKLEMFNQAITDLLIVIENEHEIIQSAYEEIQNNLNS